MERIVNYRVIVLILSILMVGNISAYGQNLNSIKSQLSAMFAGLDKSKVPTGYLWDAAVNLVDGEAYNGSALTDSNLVTLPLMADMLYSINTASVGADTICIQSVLSRIKSNSTSDNQMVGFLFKPYNYIVSNALSDHLIDYSNGAVSDKYVNGVWQNPYGEGVLFGFAMGNDGIVDPLVSFTIANIDSLSTLSFQSIEFDPGDGQGYRGVSLGGTVVASYSMEGFYETKLRVGYNNRTYVSHGFVEVLFPLIAPNAMTESIDTHTVSVNIDGIAYKAMVTGKSPFRFEKPLIVSEGFDPWKFHKYNTKDPHKYSGFTDIRDINGRLPFFNDYDVFYVDWYDCGANIRDNAEVLKEVIRWVNGQKTSETSNIVMGQSMGGLIARYALSTMELDNEEEHQTSLFISHDVPYLGANISPGLLYTYWDLYNITDNYVADVVLSNLNITKDIYPVFREVGNYTSVKQMLPMYMNSSLTYNSVFYENLQQSFKSIGFPKGDRGHPIQNVAIINGGKSPSGTKSLYSAGDTILQAEIDLNSGTLVELIMMLFCKSPMGSLWRLGKTTLSLSHTVYPCLNHGDCVSRTTASYKKKLLWLDMMNVSIPVNNHYGPSSGDLYDTFPSSKYSLEVEPDTLGSPWVAELYYDIQLTDHMAFVPTASAMCMPDDFETDLYSNNPTPGVDTPFTSYIIKNNASDHIDFWSSVSNWLEKVTNTYIDGPDMAFSGDTFHVMDSTSVVSGFKWSTSNSQVATICENTGVLTAVDGGLVDIIATYDYYGQIITKRKTVMVGIPPMTITTSNLGSNYTAIARIHNAQQKDFVNRLGLDSLLVLNWKLDTWNAGDTLHCPTILTQHTDTVSFTVGTGYDYSSIALDVIYGSHSISLNPIILQRPDVFYVNLCQINVNNDVVCFIFYPFGEIPFYMSDGDPMLILKPIPCAALDNITNLVPSYATVAGFDFPVQPHPTETGYYIVDCFYTYQGDNLDHRWLVNRVLRAIRLLDSIVIQVYNSSDQLLQTMSYRIGRFPIL